MTNLLFGGGKAVFCVLALDTSRKQWKTLQQQEEGAGGVHFAGWGNPRGESRAGGWLKPEVEVRIRGNRQPRLGGDAVTFQDMLELLAYSEYEQQMHIINQDGGDRVLARRRELVDPATQ